MRRALAAVCLAALACQGTPRDAAGWARAAVKHNRVQEKLEALEQARRAPGDRAAATPSLVSLLKEGAKVRAAAALALGEFGDPAAVKPLVAAVDLSYGGRAAETHDANRRIAEALGKLRAREAVPTLLQLTRSPDGFTQVAAVDALGQQNVEGILSAVWWSAQLAAKTEQARRFVDAFKQKYGGRAPEWYQALGYETARILFAAIQKAGSTDHEAVRNALATTKFDSLLPGGTAEFKAEFGQQVQNGFVIQQNQPDGTAPIIYPKNLASAPGIPVNPRCAK